MNDRVLKRSKHSRRRATARVAKQRSDCSKRGPIPRKSRRLERPSSFGSSYARAITLRTEVACHRPPRGALIPRAFRASAICRSDVAPLRWMAHDRDDVSPALIRAIDNLGYCLLACLVDLRIAEHDAARLGGGQSLGRALADQRA